MRVLLITAALLLFVCCNRKKKDAYSYNTEGYHYKLLAYENTNRSQSNEELYKVTLSFRNQRDSVFWDSYNNFGDFFILNHDSISRGKILHLALNHFNIGDSGAILIKTHSFFKEQFNFENVPYFSAADTVVKVNFRIGGNISAEGLVNLQNNLTMREKNKINDFFGSVNAAEASRDSLGFYWVERPEAGTGITANTGNKVIFTYEGSFLNGRFLERSPEHFELILGTPDQVLKGLNYVIRRLKIGQTAKIILPSHLAFGESGSSNGTVPPFTPLVYKIKLIDIKN